MCFFPLELERITSLYIGFCNSCNSSVFMRVYKGFVCNSSVILCNSLVIARVYIRGIIPPYEELQKNNIDYDRRITKALQKNYKCNFYKGR